MKNILLTIALISGSLIQAQVGIGTTSPKNTSLLDLTATNKGLLIPRVNLSTLTGGSISVFGLPGTDGAQDGMVVYNTSATAPFSTGEYIWYNAQWNKTGTGAGTVTSVTGTAPISVTTGTTTPVISVADATTAANGIVRLAGDLTGTAASPQIAANAVTTAEILDATIATADIADNAVTYAKINTPVTTATAAYTLLASDEGGFVYVNSGSAVTVTIPSTLPAGFHCVVIQLGAGQVTLAGSGVTLQTARGLKTRTLYSAVGVIKKDTTTATITGDGI
ncbi:hypothetical protein N0B16_03420 [Chryseobacterium sp. GMJ5]|uniref:Uncharacterized protein n=1 Tax=Chryseobacterium gilvum TaxID=2976534 RepID=A0ABT2VUE1_9FLAO|nr:hypothetical protein [Chryseobacterium gilvum]MCU7613476.1 hypothetical protein [Chryseobacterium gilvum]